MDEMQRMLTLAPDRRSVVDPKGKTVLEAREIDGRTLFVPVGQPTEEIFCAHAGVKMVCVRGDGAGGCAEWGTIEVCESWDQAGSARPLG